MGRLAAILAVLVIGAPLALAACESTQQTSKRLSRNASDLLNAEGVKVTTRNPDVKVISKSVLRDQNGVAVVVALRNAGRAQSKVPVVFTLKDGRGRTLYANTVPGLDPSLTSVSVIGRGERTFWVNNQVQTAAKPRRMEAEVGTARPAPAKLPRIVLGTPSFDVDSSGLYVRGTIENRSATLQKRLVVSCISRRGGRIVAAGRAIVEKLPPAPTKKPITFRAYFIGNPKQGTLACVAPPTVFPGGR